MDDNQITAEERECLRRWFRQAIAEVEAQEVTNLLLKRDGIQTGAPSSHRSATVRPRINRNGLKSHAMKKLLSV